MNDRTTPLILAVKHDLAHIVRDLIEAAVKINNIDGQGRTALCWAAAVNGLKVTEELLKNNAKKDVRDNKGQTPLFLGAWEGSVETVRCLLTNSADRSVRDNMEQSPEHITRQRMHMDIVELLKDYSLGCISPTALHSPPLETANFPLARVISSVDPQALMSKVPVSVQPKLTPTRQGARAKTTDHSNAKKKRKRMPRSDEDTFTTTGSYSKTVVSPSNMCYSSPSHGLSLSNGLSPSHGLSPCVLSPCSSDNFFSPTYAHGTQLPSSQGSYGTAAISLANSTTFSPPQSGSLDMQLPLPVLDEAAGLGIFEDGEVDCQEGLHEAVP